MTIAPSTPATITASELAGRLSLDEPLTVLDVRPDAAWGIEAPGLTVRHLPAAAVFADPAAVARELAGPVAVVCNRGVTAQGVALTLRAQGVDAMVLEGGMRGWIGALQSYPVELGVDGLAVRQIQRPGRGCLSYLLASGGEALVVDPAPDAGFYVALAAELGASVTEIVDTHLHADHLSGARVLAELTGATLRLPAPALARGVAYAVTPLHDGETIAIGDATVRALALPGHTTDMTGLLVGDRALISGDSLFADGIARPDLQAGDPDGARAMARTLHATLHDRVLTLAGDVVLLPGHTHPGVRTAAVAPSLAAVRDAVPELGLADPGDFAEAVLAAMPPRPANYETVIGVNAGTHAFDPDLETGGNSCSTR
jgi:glyoxylase-like metal-dependent hydrolase (beta-lactamase superfamily II)/rhodanese-related sulfurtransferase